MPPSPRRGGRGSACRQSRHPGATVPGIARSRDRGATWQLLATPVSLPSLVLDPAVPGSLFVVGQATRPACAAAHSADRGVTWSCLAGRADATLIFPDPRLGNVLYALGRGGSGLAALYKSVDGGRTWQRADRLGAHAFGNPVLVVDPTDSSHLLLSSLGHLYASTNGDASWTSLLPGPPIALVTFLVDPEAPSSLFALGFDDRVYGSGDGGLHWQEMDQGRPPFSPLDVVSNPPPPGLLQFAPHDPATLLLAHYGLYSFTRTTR